MRNPLAFLLLGVTVLILFGCSDPPFGPAPIPSDTHASTLAWTPTATPANTPTSTVPLPPTLEPVPSNAAGQCLAADGVWESEEQDFMGPILTFRVSQCGIASIEVWVYVVDGELYMVDAATALPIENDSFEYAESSGAGKLILSGVFDSAAAAHGTMKFTKGFDVFGTVLSKDAVISWKAAPI